VEILNMKGSFQIVNAVEKLFFKLGFAFFNQGIYNLNIIFARNNVFKLDKYNDSMILIWKNPSGKYKTFITEATTLPGKHYLNNPVKREGCGVIALQQVRAGWVIGKHKGKKALIQNREISIYRDGNKDNILDLDPETFETVKSSSGFNIHYANKRLIYPGRIGKASAGCMVVPFSPAYDFFIRMCEVSAERFGNAFTVTIIGLNELFCEMG